MEDGAVERDLNIEWPPNKSEPGSFGTTDVRAYSVATFDYVVNAICDVRWTSVACSRQWRASQGEPGMRETSSTGTRTTLRTADARRCVAPDFYFALSRGRMITDVIDVFRATTASHTRRRGAESDRKLRQSSRIAELYLEVVRDYTVVVGDPHLTEDSREKHGTSATLRNVDYSSEIGAYEVVDPGAAVEFFRIPARTEDRRRKPCGPGPVLCLWPLRLSEFLAWLALHRPRPAIARPSMRRRRVRGLRAQTPRPEGRLTGSPAPDRRCDHSLPPATPGWRRVGTKDPPGDVVARDRRIGGVPEPRRLRGRHGAPSALAASRPRAPTGLQHFCCPLRQRERSTPSSSRSSGFAGVVVVVGVVVVLWRGGTGYAAVRRAPRRRFPVLPDREETGVMRLRPPALRRTTARREGRVVRVQAAVVATSSA